MNILKEIWENATEIILNNDIVYLDNTQRNIFEKKYKLWELMPLIKRILIKIPTHLSPLIIDKENGFFYCYSYINSKFVYFNTEFEIGKNNRKNIIFKTNSLFEIFTLVNNYKEKTYEK